MAPVAAATLLVVGVAPRPAAADESGLYVGANLGDTLSTYRRSDIDSAVVGSFAAGGYALALSSSSTRDARLPWSADVGYRFSPYFGLEASYLELSTLEYGALGKESSLFGSSPVSVALNFKSRGPALAFVGVLPMTNCWNLEAALGAYEGKTTTLYAAEAAGSTSGSDSRTSTSLLARVGAQCVVGAHWVLQLRYTHLNQLGEKLLSQSFNVDLVTGGVSYFF